MEWNFKDGIPIYTQIIDEMTMRIASSAYAPGDKLPSVRDLALDAGVNPNTMQRALAELERRGLVNAQRTSGRFVTEDAGALTGLRKSMSDEIIQELTGRLRDLGMTDEEIIDAVREQVSSGGALRTDSSDAAEAVSE